MSKNIIFGLLALVLVAAGSYLYRPKSTKQMVAEPEVMIEKVESESSRYLPYTASVYQSAEDKRVVLYFYATWCPSCKVANAEFLAPPEKIPQDVVVLRVNYNDPDTDADEKALAAKYGITYQHTFVQIDKDGKEITKWNGGGIAELLTKLK